MPETYSDARLPLRWGVPYRERLAVLLGVLAACHTPAPTRVTPPRQAKLVVMIVIDQLPSWAFERDRALYTGGLGRLLREGAYVRRARLPYASTFTAPGHATIATGAPPSVHGVVGNQWWRRIEQRERPAEYDATAPVLPVVDLETPLSADANASAHALRVSGVADALRTATQGRGHTVAIALKARSACLISGQHPELAVWYDAGAGGMTTSTAYADAAPAWLRALAKALPPNRFIGQIWKPLDGALLAAHTGIPDDSPGEGALHGMGTAFPHTVHDLEELIHTPFGDVIVMDAVKAALDAVPLGSDEIPDLLAISFSAHDYAGHNWGPDSWEVLDLTIRLDAALGDLFTTLDRRLGPDGWAVVLTSDHGATPLVERSPVAGARRFAPLDLATTGGTQVAKVSSNQVYMTSAWAQLPIAEQKAGMDAAAAAIRTTYPEIDVFVTADRTHCAEDGLVGDVCRSVMPGESGELYLAPHRGFVITEYKTGTQHDAPNADNQEVPILVRAPGLTAQTVERGSLLQVAPTVAALLGIAPPASATASPLFGIAARSPARP